MNHETLTDFSLDEIKEELEREQTKEKAIFSFRNTVTSLLAVFAIVSLLTIYVFPILRITGTSMEPTLDENDIVLVYKTKNLKPGDIVAFYYNNNAIVKRVIALEGDVVDMDQLGNVTVNGEALAEPYVTEKSFGECNITFPYTVPESRIFVMGDHRSISIDSRNSAIGSITKGQIIGKVLFRFWPLVQTDLIHQSLTSIYTCGERQ